MEIDFLIQWNNKVIDKTDLASKIKEMLTQLFRNVEDNKFYFDLDDDNDYKVDYKNSEKDEKVYLKISCDYSEAKSAKVLSSIRDIICNGEHRKDFLVICTYDEASLSYCCRLMRPFGIFERHLRELMYLITVKAFGVDWVEKSFPKEMIDKIKEQTHGKVRNEKLTETAFEWLDYSEIIEYLFSERYLEYTAEYAMDNELSDEKLKLLSKEGIINIISKARKEILWDKLFLNNEKIGRLTKKDMESFRVYRNDIMHHHTISEERFKIIQKDIGKANQSLRLAINEIESKIYTQEEYRTVFSLSGNIITGIISTFNKIFDINVLNISNVIGKALENLMNMVNAVPNITKTMNQVIRMITLPSEMTDYSKFLENHTESPIINDCYKSSDSTAIQHDSQDFQSDVENNSKSSSY